MADGARVATNAGEIPADWRALAPDGSCVENPFQDNCGAKGQKVERAYFPSAERVAGTRSGQPQAGGPQSAVTGPTGRGIQVAEPTNDPSDVKAAGVGACFLYRYNPRLVPHSSGPDTMQWSGATDCPAGYTYAEITTTLYRNTGVRGTRFNNAFGYAPRAYALGGYSCYGNDAANFYASNLGYSVDGNNNSYAASGNSITIYRHCG